jgi:uncharacterized membrane protein YccF (DUF307 family)
MKKEIYMKTLGNILWFIFGGVFFGLCSYLIGALCCVTIVLIPIGLQYFKLGKFFFWPFGKQVVNVNAKSGKTILNVLWAILFGWEQCLTFAFTGIIFCITIVGIPFGLQYFKMAAFVLLPLGHDFK